MEIERKFLVKSLPDISQIQPIRYERYYLRSDVGTQERIQKKGDKYEREILRTISNLQRTKEKQTITQEEFDELKKGKENEGIIRDSYLLSNNPNTSIKIYQGKYKGLMRAEIEFESEEEAKAYMPELWMGNEITHSPLGQDARLLHLTQDEFKNLLDRESQI